MEESNKNDVYIYNLKQAYFYIRVGVDPVGVGFNPIKQKYYFHFKKNETQEAYDLWCKKCEEYKLCNSR
jgi:hypothetical protein